jgi:hypothetical protein
MKGMSIAPEQVQAPATDAVLFRSSPVRTFVIVLLLLMLSFGLVSPIVALIAGGTGNPWWHTALQAGVISTLAAGCYSWSIRASLTTWIRVSSGGLELAAQGSDPVLLDWPDVAKVEVRRAGMRSVLEVTPVAMDRVHPVDDPEAGEPAMSETAAAPAYTADLTELWPGPRALRRELARHLPPT